MSLRPLQGILLDLDECVIETRSIGEHVVDGIVRRVADDSSLSVDVAAFRQDVWRLSFDKLVERYALPEPARADLFVRWSAVEVERPPTIYPDFSALIGLRVPLVLVTTGFRRLQWSKINAASFARAPLTAFFDDIVIDALDERNRWGKERVFVRLMKGRRWSPSEVCAIGDGGSEMRAARRLGIFAIQIDRGSAEQLPFAVDARVTSFSAVPETLRRAGFAVTS